MLQLAPNVGRPVVGLVGRGPMVAILLVTRRYNSVLEEMQAKWVKEQNERLSEKLSDNQTIDPRKSLDSLNGSQEGVIV